MELVADINNPQNLRIRLPARVKDRWSDLLSRKRISQQDAIVALVDLVLSENDDVVRSMLLGQTAPRPDLMEHVLRGIAVRAQSKPTNDRMGTKRRSRGEMSGNSVEL